MNFAKFLRTPFPTNIPRVFHVETTWRRSFPRRFNVEYKWSVCRENTFGRLLLTQEKRVFSSEFSKIPRATASLFLFQL